MEKLYKRNDIYEGRVVHLVNDEVEIDDGSHTFREVVYHRGGACIALKDKDNKYLMVRQFRYALDREMLEFCAGKLEKGEDPDDAIIREAREELGSTVKNLVKLGYMIPTCGYSSEKIYLYYGEKEDSVSQDFDEDERIDLDKHSFGEIKEMIKSGVINDAKTICLVSRMILNGIEE